MSRALYHTRKVRNVVALGLSMFAAATGLIILALILATLFINGFAAIKPSIFMEMSFELHQTQIQILIKRQA